MTDRAIFKKCDDGTWIKDNPVTNFEKYISSMTESDLAVLILHCPYKNSCSYCIQHPKTCDGNCVGNIETWLKKESGENE